MCGFNLLLVLIHIPRRFSHYTLASSVGNEVDEEQSCSYQRIIFLYIYRIKIIRLKGLCHGSAVDFVYFANYSPSIAMGLKPSKEIRCK